MFQEKRVATKEIFFFKCFIAFRERKGERRERYIYQSAASCTLPDWGSSLQLLCVHDGTPTS